MLLEPLVAEVVNKELVEVAPAQPAVTRSREHSELALHKGDHAHLVRLGVGLRLRLRVTVRLRLRLRVRVRVRVGVRVGLGLGLGLLVKQLTVVSDAPMSRKTTLVALSAGRSVL